MVSLEQIRALEARVEKAVVLIDKLRRENAELEQRLIEASSSEEQVKAAYSELERKSAASLQTASDSEALIRDLNARLAAAEERVKTAEERVKDAEAENASYRDRTLAAERKSADLESKAEELQREQSRIEEGLTHALQKLDAFEDLVMGISVGNADVAVADEVSDAGEEKAESVDQSPSAPEPQESPFLGASFRGEQLPGDSSQGDEHELDIF
ncbi:MAG: hypothetical protein WCX13_00500 [Candidatus Hydrogenedentales bacterium]